MRKFRKDDLVVLARKSDPRYNPMGAKTGSLAIVTADEERYVKVRWLDRTTAGDQSDGAYDPANFDFANAAEAKKIYAILDAEAQRAFNWTPPVRPFQVGDAVKYPQVRRDIGIILSIHEDYAFIHWSERTPGLTSHGAYKLEALKLNGDCDCA